MISALSKSMLSPVYRNFSMKVGASPLKHKIPQKRASSLHTALKAEEFERLRNGRQWPGIRAGDSIEVDQFPHATATESEKSRGVVVGIYNKASDSCVEYVNSEYGTPFIRRVIMYNPLVKNIKVLQKRFIKGGERRVKRSKLYYLYERDPQIYTVGY